MEENHFSELNVNGPTVNPQTESKSRFNPSFIALIALIGFVVILGSIFAWKSTQKNTSTVGVTPTPAPAFTSIAPHSLVYGFWQQEQSQIHEYNLNTGKDYTLATIPTNIKNVHVISPQQIMYIGQTDSYDHGKEITFYSLTSKSSTSLLTADEGFGIDTFLLSPDKKMLVVWEVAFAPNSSVLLNGKSRIYSLDISNPQQKNLIYDESASSFIHYPIAITTTGDMFFDTFLPNSGAGWAYGMTTSNFNGTTKSSISSMQNGTYGTIPTVSYDGNFLLFAGYDGSKGNGTIETANGFRNAIVSSNTIELFNLQNKTRQKLENLPNTDIYKNITWGNNSTNYFSFYLLSTDNTQSGYYTYSLGGNTKSKISAIPSNNLVVSSITNNLFLLGTLNNLETPSNLGNTYSSIFSLFSVINRDTSKITKLGTAEQLVQFIGIVDDSFFANIETSTKPNTSSKSNLQLGSFAVKEELTARPDQQSNPPPITAPQIPQNPNTPIPTTAPVKTCEAAIAETICKQRFSQSDPQYLSCFYDEQKKIEANQQQQIAKQLGIDYCYATPLYLYGENGTRVTITIDTPIFNSNLFYNDGYHITLRGKGKIEQNGTFYESITSDYIPKKKFTPPTRGIISSKADLPKILSYVANNLGLNQKELQDLQEFAQNSLESPYAFVSFYDDKTSKEILPISFSPTPDSYRNIVFYFKQLATKPNQSYELPSFEKIERKGFTAVEISHIVE